MKIGLVDDRRIDLDKLNGIISSLDGVEIVFSTTSADEAYEYIKKEAVDLLIADIEMPIYRDTNSRYYSFTCAEYCRDLCNRK